jgi:hypothetical protein
MGAGIVTMRLLAIEARARRACSKNAREVSLVGTPSKAKAAP